MSGHRLRAAAFSAAILLTSAAAHAQDARLRLEHLDKLASRATETVNIALDGSLLRLAAGVLSDRQPEEAAVKDLLQGIREIQVRSYEFGSSAAYSDADVQAIRQQLTGPAWSRIIGVKSGSKGEDVEIYVWREKDRTGGIAILAAEPDELTVVNIVGSLDLAKLAALSGQFGIPRLTLPNKEN
jgi:uncharacterized protein DUF4252